MSIDMPEGWRSAQLGEISRIVTGKTPSTKEPAFWGGDMPFVTPSDITDGPWLGHAGRYLSDEGMKYSSVVPAGSVLFTCIASIGKSCITKEVSTLNQQINACVPSAQVDAYFLYSALQARVGDMLDLAGTTAVPIINKSTFSKVFVKLPPLDEQRRIAEVLRSADEAIAASVASIEQGERIKQGLNQTLFERGIGHTKFKVSLSGEIPETWDERPLVDLVSDPITYGVVQPGPSDHAGVPFIRGGDFPNGKINVRALRTISPIVAKQYKRTQLKGGEIVVSLVGYPGACAIVPVELAGANVARQAALIRTNGAVSTEYLFQFIRSPICQGRLLASTIGSAQQVINLKDLKEIVVAIPPRDEQEQIATILNGLDQFLEDETSNLSGSKSLKVSLQADLLSGHVRVPA